MAALIKERLAMETTFQEDMQARKEEFAKALDDIRDADAEEYNILKVRLESDLQTLEQHHATMQALHICSNSKFLSNLWALIPQTPVGFFLDWFSLILLKYFPIVAVTGSLSV